jgi:hypothetical protein
VTDGTAPVEETFSNVQTKVPTPPRPALYQGHGHIVPLIVWLFTVETWLAACCIPQKQWLTQVSLMLAGPALTWWMRRVQDNSAANIIETWESFRAALIDSFTVPNSIRANRDKIATCSQNGQSVLAYAEAFRNLLLLLPAGEMNAAEQYDRFYRGLRTGLRAECLKAGVSTLDEAISLCERIESSYSVANHSSGPAQQQNNRFRPRRFPKSAALNTVQNTPSGGNSRRPANAQMNNPRSPPAFGLSSSELDRHRTEGRCFNCHRSGHLWRACPSLATSRSPSGNGQTRR